jgi:HPt (histidine-containing phosphotransfer) domain-containing protein
MVQLFLEQAPLRLAAARHGLEGGDARAVRDAVHALKSSSGQLGAPRMQALCARIEALASAGEIDTLPPLLEGLDEAFAHYRAWLS